MDLFDEVYDYIGDNQGCERDDIIFTFDGDYQREEIEYVLDTLEERNEIKIDREYCFTVCKPEWSIREC